MKTLIRGSRTGAFKQQPFVYLFPVVRLMELFVGSEHSDLYQKYRPTYPSTLYKFIAEFCHAGTGTLGSAVDVGCGTGHSTRPLCDYFRHVTGIDVSKTQLEAARAAHAQSNMSFVISEGERLGAFSDGSMDLVTVAQAMHWIDQEPFFREVERVLKPGGALVVYGYGNCQFDSDRGNQVINNFYRKDLEGFWDSRRHHIDNSYQEISLPFSGWKRNMDFVIQNSWSTSEVTGYLSTWSAWRSYLKQNPESDVLKKLQQQLEEIYHEQKAVITWPVFVLLGRKPITS